MPRPTRRATRRSMRPIWESVRPLCRTQLAYSRSRPSSPARLRTSRFVRGLRLGSDFHKRIGGRARIVCVWRYGRCQRVVRSIALQKRRFLACNEIGSIISIDQHTHAAVEIEFDDKCGCAALSTLGVTIACSVAANGPRGRHGVGWSHVYAWVAHDPFEGVAETKRESTGSPAWAR